MCLLILARAKVGNMNKNTQIYIGIVAIAAIGIYFYMKQKGQLEGWKKGYTVLQDQINSTTPTPVTP